MEHPFTPLPPVLSKNGFTYAILKRGSNAMIYEQRVGKKTIAYEVFKIVIDKSKEILGKRIPARERFPKNADFGFSAWTYRTLEEAKQKFDELELRN